MFGGKRTNERAARGSDGGEHSGSGGASGRYHVVCVPPTLSAATAIVVDLRRSLAASTSRLVSLAVSRLAGDLHLLSTLATMPVGLEVWFNQVPPITRGWLAFAVLTSLAVVSNSYMLRVMDLNVFVQQCQMVTPLQLYFSYKSAFKNAQACY